MNKRIIGSIILILICIPAFIIGGKVFLLLTGLIALLAYKEINDLYKNNIVISILGLISLLILIYNNCFNNMLFNNNLPILLPFILLIPTIFIKNTKITNTFSLISFILFIGLSLNNLNINILYSKMIILYLVSITVLNDTFAYLTGRSLGKHKLTSISPNKTVEGFIGGNIIGIIGGIIIYLIFVSTNNILNTIIITILLNISCVIGDLLFSKIKREYNIKDYSKLIPGHGGILDRFDSLLFVSLIYLIITTII